MAQQPENEPDLEPAEEAARFRKDPREHGGLPEKLNDDQLARLTEEERVAAGLDDYDPDEVPPATDVPPEADVTTSPEYQAEREEIERQVAEGELDIEGRRRPVPPTRYDES